MSGRSPAISVTPIFVDAALVYAKRGWAVFPLRGKSKVPMVPAKWGGKGCLDATRDEMQVRDWWKRWPHANIGIATGGSSGFFVVDIDPDHGGEESLMTLVESHGEWPSTVYARTGGGGVHYLFRAVPGLRNDQAGKLGQGIDIRAEGGYIVAPPSIHPSGSLYAWDVDHHPDDCLIAEAPVWLIERLRERATTAPAAAAAASAGTNPRTTEAWRRLVAEGVGEGSRNKAVARLAGLLLRRYVDPFVALDLIRCWNTQRCRPPLEDAELVRTVNSIARIEFERRAKREENGRRKVS
jgi:hypothetical protein